MASSLLRLFQRDDFDSRLALHYLYLYPDNIGIQHQICEAMKVFAPQEIEFLLPQLVHLLITRTTDSAALEEFIVDQCERSDHIAILTFWQIRSYATDFRGTVNKPALKILRRLYHKTQAILVSAPLDREPNVLSNYGAVVPMLVGLSTMLAGVGAPALAQVTKSLVVAQGKQDSSSTQESRPQSRINSVDNLPQSESQVSLSSEQVNTNNNSVSVTPSSPAIQSSSTDSHQQHHPLPEIQPRSSSLLPPPPEVVASMDMIGPSFEDLSLGRAFAKSPSFLAKSTSRVADDVDSVASQQNGVNEDLNMVDESQQPLAISERTQYFQRELQFITLLSDISDRLRSVPKPSRQRTLVADLTLLNHNLPAEVCVPVWCQGGYDGKKHHIVVRVPPNDAVILNSADRVPYLLLMEIVEGNIEDFETIESDEEEDSEGEADEQSEVEPSVVSEQSAIATPTSILQESVTSNEAIVQQLEKQGPLPPALLEAKAEVEQYTEKTRTAAIMLAQLYKQQQRELMIAMTADQPQPPQSSGNNPSNETNPSSSSTGTAGVPRSSMGVARGASPATTTTHNNNNTSSPSSSPQIPRKTPQKINADYELIRNRLVKEMAVLEENRLKALEKQRQIMKELGLEPSRSDGEVISEPLVDGTDAVVKDKDDPSAAVFKEAWEEKVARIRATSPYGSNPTWELISVIVKSGSDLRQEVLALQAIKEMQRIWAEQNIPVWVHSYRILVTSDQGGLVETVKNSISLHSIKKEGYRRKLNQNGAAYTLFDYFIHTYGPVKSESFKRAQDAFMRSMAGYSIACYLLQIKDRHNGNILIDTEGHQIHIDFGFMLSNSPGSMGFEAAPFKLPQEFIDILGGVSSAKFAEYRKLCKDAFLAVRRRWDVIVGLVEIMERESKLPCFIGATTKPSTVYVPPSANSIFGFLGQPEPPTASVSTAPLPTPPTTSTSLGSNSNLPVSMRLRERFGLSLPEKQVEALVDRLVDSSINSVFTRLYDVFQFYSQGIL